MSSFLDVNIFSILHKDIRFYFTRFVMLLEISNDIFQGLEIQI